MLSAATQANGTPAAMARSTSAAAAAAIAGLVARPTPAGTRATARRSGSLVQPFGR